MSHEPKNRPTQPEAVFINSGLSVYFMPISRPQFVHMPVPGEQHLHLCSIIFIKPAAMTRIGHVVMTAACVSMSRRPSRKTRPKRSTRSGSILWCGQAHPPDFIGSIQYVLKWVVSNSTFLYMRDPALHYTTTPVKTKAP